MKRHLGTVVLISVAVAMCWTAVADATSLSIVPDPLVASPGTSVLTSVGYTAQGAQVAALQFDVLYNPSALSLTTATAGSAATLAGKSLDFNTLSPGDTRFIVSGFNQNVIGDGSVTDLKFHVSLTAPTGPYNLFLSGVFASDPNGNSVSITNLNRSVPAPETTSLLLWGSGLAGLAAWRLRRKGS